MRATSSLTVVRTREELRSELRSIRAVAGTMSLVPTMGSLHPGHLSLVDRARQLSDTTAVSVFVNPLQFGQGEDFSNYPRDLERDLELLAARGVRLVFIPGEEVMYPRGKPVVQVDPGEIGDRLCGPFRPGHFSGVLTVVAKLFGLFRPDWAVFGRKDFQQSVLVQKMADDLELGVRIEVAPTVREADGLALSSRNGYLGDEERREALGIWQALSEADAQFRAGQLRADRLIGTANAVVSRYPNLRVQYVECVDPLTLRTVETCELGTVMALAAFVEGARLIDNVVLGHDAPDPRVGSGTVGGSPI